MSYTNSLLAAYPSSYDLSTSLTDDLFPRSPIGNLYEPSAPYSGSTRLLSDDFVHRPIGLGRTSYRQSLYSEYPSTNFRTTSITNWRRGVPSYNSFTSYNNIREYSDSLDTTSNSNTASSLTHSFRDTNRQNIFPTYRSSYNHLINGVTNSPRKTTLWSPILSTIQTNDEKLTSTHQFLPTLSPTLARKMSATMVSNKDKTSIPSQSPPPLPEPIVLPTEELANENNEQENEIEQNPIAGESEKEESSNGTETPSNEKKDESPVDDRIGEDAWTTKMDRLHTMRELREKEKAKTSRILPKLPVKKANKSLTYRSAIVDDDQAHETSLQMRGGSYFDALFDGNFFRKSSKNQYKLNQTQPRSLSMRNPNPLKKPSIKIIQSSPSTKKPIASEPANTTHKSIENQSIKPIKKEAATPRELDSRNPDDRYRVALNKFRNDRIEQLQRETNESTSKRLTYGYYVRHLTKEELLQKAVKPSPWSDFIDLKKGHLYSITAEEKKQLYNESKSYGERVRNRNLQLRQTQRVNPSKYLTLRWSPKDQKSESSDDETSREQVNEEDSVRDHDNRDNSNASQQSESSSTAKSTGRTYVRHFSNEDTTEDKANHTTLPTDQSSTNRTSDDDENYNDETSDFEASRKQKQRRHGFKHESSTRTTSETEQSESDITSQQHSAQTRTRDTDDELFIVREEKTVESLEGRRYHE